MAMKGKPGIGGGATGTTVIVIVVYKTLSWISIIVRASPYMPGGMTPTLWSDPFRSPLIPMMCT